MEELEGGLNRRKDCCSEDISVCRNFGEGVLSTVILCVCCFVIAEFAPIVTDMPHLSI